MLTAKDIMTKSPITVAADTDIMAAARLLLEKGFNGMPVVHAEGQLVGVLCQSDLIVQQKKVQLPSLFTLLDGFFPLSSTNKLERELERMTATTVAQAMTPNPVSVRPDTPIDELATLMAEKKLYTLPVVTQGRLVGVVGKEDILRAVVGSESR